MRKNFFIILICPVFFVLFSCSAQINGSFRTDSSAEFSVSAALEPRMTTLIQRLSAAGGAAGSQVINGPAISTSMLARGFTFAALRNTSSSSVEGIIRFSNLRDFLSAAEYGNFIIFEQTNSGGRCEININRDNGPVILELFSPDVVHYLNALMAPIASKEEDYMTKSRYLQEVTMMYGRPVSDEIANSRIRASIEFPGPVTSVRGGTFSGRRADFDISVLDLLVLETPIRLEVRWR